MGRALTPGEIFEITRTRETSLSRLLMLYITTGLAFMLLPGTFLGVWNLLAISSRHASNSVSAGWVQAHGHAQIFGWIGTFILGIGFYSIPKLRRMNPFALWAAWVCWALWTSGITLRWLTGVYQWQWRVVLPVSAALEVVAFVIFFHSVSGHRPQDSGRQKLDEWVLVVIAAATGLLLTLLVNLGAAMWLAYRGISPDLPTEFDQRFLVLETWGFLVPFVWGFSAKWLPIFLGLRPVRGRVLLLAVAVNSAGVIAAMMGWMRPAVLLLLGGILIAVWALSLLERTRQPPKVKGVHASFPVFVRLAYVWAIVAAALGIWANSVEGSHGIWGASRHALTVGFLATMVFSVGQRVLPAFSGMRLLFSTRLMFLSLLLLGTGCLLRVSSEILAYQGFANWAWSWLPVSAIIEMTAVTIFAVNLLFTFARRPAAQEAPVERYNKE
ncbi:MAG: NnrS family protein [Acidobacteriia bacterium]|nr:NnrS family protein [Terriglobia bacterium]